MSPCSDEEYFYKLNNIIIRSTQYLRQIFKQRWKLVNNEDWRDEPDYIQNFLSEHCKNVLKKALPFQKKILLESCTTEDWDTTLMSLILLNFGDGKQYELQNKAVRQIKDLRNDLAHHKSKRLTQTDYSWKLKIFKESLQILQVAEKEIDNLIEETGIRSPLEDFERLIDLLENAEKFMKLKDFESALNQYSEAINIPRLSPENLGNVYEKRAACYLSIKNKRLFNGKHTDQAILDVEQALQLNKSSWNALYLKAQCHRKKNNLSEAIHYYQLALSISPEPKQVKEALDSCVLLDSVQKSNANIDLDRLPITGSDLVGDAAAKSDQNLTITEYAELHGYKNAPVFLGDRYYHGLDVPQNYAKAFKYYTKADELGYAEGCFAVGTCYYRGHGVQQNVAKSVEIFKRCASMDAKKIKNFENVTPLGFNNGVASAEYAIGKCYENATGVEEDLAEAVIWYTRAMEHGQAEASACLGHLYYNGLGLTENHKMAEMCWKQGLNLEDTESAELLVVYYRYHLEPEMAWIMFQIGKEMGSSRFLKIEDEDFNQNLISIQSDRWRLEERIAKFEREHGIEVKGMTFRQKVGLSDQYFRPNFPQIKSSSIFNSGDIQIEKIGKNIEMAIGIKNMHDSLVTFIQQSKSVLERKEYLKSPVRKGLILQHRERLRDATKLKNQNQKPDKKCVLVDKSVIPWKLQQTRAKKMAQLKPITLQEMNPTKDRIYENRILDLTVIDEPSPYNNSIQLIAEDKYGDSTRVYVDTVGAKDVFVQRFSAGSRIAVVNPYMGTCAKSRVNGIRINEPKSIIFLEKAKDLCGFCGEENATRNCSKCKRLYCSRECQKLDWQLFEHKLICVTVPEYKKSIKMIGF